MPAFSPKLLTASTQLQRERRATNVKVVTLLTKDVAIISSSWMLRAITPLRISSL